MPSRGCKSIGRPGRRQRRNGSRSSDQWISPSIGTSHRRRRRSSSRACQPSRTFRWPGTTHIRSGQDRCEAMAMAAACAPSLAWRKPGTDAQQREHGSSRAQGAARRRPKRSDRAGTLRCPTSRGCEVGLRSPGFGWSLVYQAGWHPTLRIKKLRNTGSAGWISPCRIVESGPRRDAAALAVRDLKTVLLCGI